jgi:outer membrane receptor for ferrienterochelin and colicin
MKIQRYIFPSLLITAFPLGVNAQDVVEPDDSLSMSQEIDEVVVTARQRGIRKSLLSAQNTDLISSSELKRAACCNLGESFTTNPSVDVSYGDAATGSKQIKLLGLSGTYVQMLTENIPNFRGAAAAYGLDYLAGPWMHSIQVSKGASSVKNGYESITGQINVEMLKPQNDQSLALNLYANHMGKLEANATGNIYLSPKWSTGLLLHGENMFASHDENSDGFIDTPKLRQFSGMNRWAYMSDSYIFQAGVKFTGESRKSGQDGKHAMHTGGSLYKVDIDTKRWEAFAKNAYIFDQDAGANVALMLSGSIHDQDSEYGYKLYDVLQKNFYASLMFESKYGEEHFLSTGLSFNYDNYDQNYNLVNRAGQLPEALKEVENVPGAYVQYTYNSEDRLYIMAGLRYDYSSVFKSMVTPRMHIRWTPVSALSLYGSVGKGYRNPHRLADYSYLLASSRRLLIDDNNKQESAWNMGGGATSYLMLFDRAFTLTGEYYYTQFKNQAVVDLDSDAHAAHLMYNSGKSYSHTVQVELSYQPIKDFTFSAAYRYTDVKENYGNGIMRKPLSAKSKGLFSINYSPRMGIWQFDATLALNGGGRMPSPYTTSDGRQSWSTTYKAFPQLNAQITRNFRHWALYIGGENLTGYRQKNPIIDAANPWGDNFDATMIYAPIHGAVAYIGVRYTFTKY